MFGGLSRDNNDRDGTVAAPDVLEKAEPTHFSHLDVGDDTCASRQCTRSEKLLRRKITFRLIPTRGKKIE